MTISTSPLAEESDATSYGRRLWEQVRTPRFLKALFLGQFLAVCITITNTSSTALAMLHGVSIPTTQSFLNYVLLAFVFNSLSMWRVGWEEFMGRVWRHWWKYLLLAVIDVEANYFVVKSFNYTSMLSAMLLDCWAIPVVVVLSMVFLHVRYRWTHYLGLVVCLGGILLLLFSDNLSGEAPPNALKGDLFVILGATLYGVSNVLEERLVRAHPISEVLGGLGFFGMFVNGIQLVILERAELENVNWSPEVIGMIIGFDIALFLFYCCTPILFRIAGATFFNLSLLTADIYGLVVGVLLLNSPYSNWYPGAFIGIIVGVVIFNIRNPRYLREEQGEVPAEDIITPPKTPTSQMSA